MREAKRQSHEGEGQGRAGRGRSVMVRRAVQRSGNPSGNVTGGAEARSRKEAFTLLELLLAATLACAVLAAAWGWLWAVAVAAHEAGKRTDLSSSLAFARRQILRDARAAHGLAAPDGAAGCGAHSLALELGTVPATSDPVQYAVNDSRGVLWRRTPSSHVAEGVTRFDVSYYAADGAEIAPTAGGRVSPSELPKVALVRIAVALESGRAEREARWSVVIP